jgi:hypothetical protein
MSWWKILDASVLLLCASMYLGTGWSLVLFSFPGHGRLTVDNYYDQFVPPVERATKFFTWWTVLMMAAAVVLIVADWHSWYVLAPAVLLAAVIAATGLTVKFIFPYNKRMEAHIRDPAALQVVLGKWIRLNWIRTSIWTVEWVAITTWFAVRLG